MLFRSAGWAKDCVGTNVDCTLDVANNGAVTYTTKCNAGYGNIQNNGTFNASCTANEIEIKWTGVATPGTGTTFTPVSEEPNAYTSKVYYDGDIITPQAVIESAGQSFLGWKFVSPAN